MHYGKTIRTAAVIGTFALIVSGCSLFGSGGNKEAVDPPQAGSIEETVANMPDMDMAAKVADGTKQTTTKTNAKDTGTAQSGSKDTGTKQTGTTQTGTAQSGTKANDKAASANQQTEAMTIFAKDDQGFVVPVTLQLPKTSSAPLTMLQYMVVGGPGDADLPHGFASLLPKGTKVNIKVKDKVATADFSKELLQYERADERKLLEGITWTLTSLSSVQKVQLLVDGKPLTEMPQGKLPVSSALSRSIGINLEIAAGTEVTRSTPVTLYYMNVNDSNYKYYVPVTRLIPRTDDMAQAVLNQLIQGPEDKTALLPTVSASAKVLSMKPSNGLITVDLSKGLLDKSNQVPGEALQAVVLSLTENTGAAKVQIMVDGKLTFQSTDKLNYSKPVTKPEHVNEVKL